MTLKYEYQSCEVFILIYNLYIQANNLQLITYNLIVELYRDILKRQNKQLQNQLQPILMVYQ